VAVYAYLDSSALVKLAVREDEPAALESDVVHREALFTSIVAETELRTLVIDGDGLTPWRLGLDQRFSDSFRIDLLADHDRLAASPRSVSLGLDRTGIAGHAQWTPDFNWTGDLWLRRNHYSDSNASVGWDAALRRAVVRKPGFMLDLGAIAQHLSFDENPGHGYYAPDSYRRYALTVFSYVGLGENAGSLARVCRQHATARRHRPQPLVQHRLRALARGQRA